MKKILFVLVALSFMTMMNVSMAKDRTIVGYISDFGCGDNCYLSIKQDNGKMIDALCAAPVCRPWSETAEMPRRFIGKKVRVTVGKDKQYDGAGTVMGNFRSFKKIQFLD